MACGDVFAHTEVCAFALADFATRCGVDRNLVRRAGWRVAKLAVAQAEDTHTHYGCENEQRFLLGIATLVTEQAKRLLYPVENAAL